ncbi:MAG: hypothetical protein F6K47_00415 [Symploca sp. SIO2E6]|nr:hypothetical protein [Symploca sp. SIO2E6]
MVNGLVAIASLMLSCPLKVDLNYAIAYCSDTRLLKGYRWRMGGMTPHHQCRTQP